jgi:hypothetical protein
MPRTTAVIIGLVCAVAAGLVSRPAATQPQFAVEVEGGRTVGLTPYLRNVVYTDAELGGQEYAGTEPFRPYLADERSGWGNRLAARFVTNGIVAGLSFQWFDIGVADIHHRGHIPGSEDDRLRPTRIRPDGTIDDSSVEYRPLDETQRLSMGETKATNLFVLGLEGGYRFYVYQGEFDIFVPAGGSLVVTRLGRPNSPFRPGLGAYSGLAATFDFISVMSIVAGSRIHGFVTPEYWNRSDAARRSAALGNSTESALFSSQVSVSIDVAVQFSIR